ncbi:MAG: hypothetical protein U0Q22_19510 [Acidimicrobiales bacterium]
MSDLRANYDRLDEMASQLSKIGDRLKAVDDKDDSSADDFGDGVLLAAVRKFVKGWRDGRTEITEGIDGLSANLKKAADAYRKYDEAFKKDGSTPARTPLPTGRNATRPGWSEHDARHRARRARTVHRWWRTERTERAGRSGARRGAWPRRRSRPRWPSARDRARRHHRTRPERSRSARPRPRPAARPTAGSRSDDRSDETHESTDTEPHGPDR